MKPSIRRIIVINLLLAVTLIVSLMAAGIYYVTNFETEHHIDAELVTSSLVFEALLSDRTKNKAELAAIQQSLDNIPAQRNDIITRVLSHKDHAGNISNSAVQYQIWDKQGNLLLHSSGTPNTPLSDGTTGFSDTYIGNAAWRIYTYNSVKTPLTIIMAENFSEQHILRDAMVGNNLIVMLVFFPLLGVMIWFIVNRHLRNIHRLANEIAQRAPRYLEPVDLKKVPIEVQPLIDELNKLFIRLTEAFEREQRFAADAAHELRTPMAAIKTQTQVALNTESTADLKTALHKILAGVDRSTHVVQQLLTLSRLSPGSAMDKQQAIDIVAIVKEIIAELVPLALENHAEIEFSSSHNKIMLLGNTASLGILTRNLIDNAIRYTPDDGNGRVKVELEKKATQITLRVSDNGPGIPEKLHSRVFERFFRVLGSQKPGSGLGLAIVQQIAALHNAELKLSSPDVGTGLVFEVTFPNRLPQG